MSTPLQATWKRFARKPAGLAGAAVCVLIAFAAVSAPWLSPHDPNRQNLENRIQPPSAAHWLGTDDVGRDILSRLLHGSRITMQVGLTAVGIALALGVPLALLALAGGRAMDAAVVSIIDVFLAFPALVLAMAVIAILGQNLTNAMIAIGIVYMPRFARILRAAALGEMRMDYVTAARGLSCSTARILFRHVIPNCVPPLLVAATLYLATAILEAAALSFLGLGAQPPSPEWGAMLYQGRRYLLQAPYMTYFPGLAIFAAVLGINLLGDALNDALAGR